MAGSRARARDFLVRALYQWQIAGHDRAELQKQFASMAEYPRIDAAYFEALLGQVIDDVAALDSVIAQFATRGPEQLDAVGRAVLLVAIAELKFHPDVPRKVAINEAVKLAKRYGAADSFRFVNAVADRAAESLRGATPDRA